mmetsp:Transcript_797/g.1497  ORF Transcript_797/g.1497 Transcript_797/m.1497 type:complete len:204 (+) Transcript_797:627-1238(+)
MFHRQHLHVVRVDRPARSSNVNLCRRRHNHVLLHLWVHQAKPAFRVRLNHDLNLTLLLPWPPCGTICTGLWLADGNHDLSATAFQELAKFTGCLSLLGRRKGDPAKAFTSAALTLFSSQVDPLDLPNVLQCRLDTLLVNVRRKLSQKNCVFLFSCIVSLHGSCISLLSLRVTCGLDNCTEWAWPSVRRSLLQSCLRHRGCRTK